MVEVGTAKSGEKEIKTDWPVEEGLTAGTQKQTGRQSNLTPTESSKVLSKDRTGV